MNRLDGTSPLPATHIVPNCDITSGRPDANSHMHNVYIF